MLTLLVFLVLLQPDRTANITNSKPARNLLAEMKGSLPNDFVFTHAEFTYSINDEKLIFRGDVANRKDDRNKFTVFGNYSLSGTEDFKVKDADGKFAFMVESNKVSSALKITGSSNVCLLTINVTPKDSVVHINNSKLDADKDGNVVVFVDYGDCLVSVQNDPNYKPKKDTFKVSKKADAKSYTLDKK